MKPPRSRATLLSRATPRPSTPRPRRARAPAAPGPGRTSRAGAVSHAFLYGNPDLRARIEHLRAQARPQPVPATDANSDNTIIQALTSQISHLKKQHRDQTQALHAALEQAHGENLQLRRELTRLGWTGEPATT
jgi:hypothetical protein